MADPSTGRGAETHNAPTSRGLVGAKVVRGATQLRRSVAGGALSADAASATRSRGAIVRAYHAASRRFGRQLGGDLRSAPRSGLPPSPDRWCGPSDLLVPVTAF